MCRADRRSAARTRLVRTVSQEKPAEVCSISILQQGCEREFYARVRAGSSTYVTGPWSTRSALLDHVAKWLADEAQVQS